MHVAVGRPEARADAGGAGAERGDGGVGRRRDPDLVIPEPLLLLAARRRGWSAATRRRARLSRRPPPRSASNPTSPACWRRGGGGTIDEAAFEAGLAPALAAPVLNLRQGAFARRRAWKIEARGCGAGSPGSRWRWPLLSLVLQIVTIMRYTFAADRLEAEAAALGGRARPAARPAFGALARAAVRSGPRDAQCRARPDRIPRPTAASRRPSRRQPGDARRLPPARRGERARGRGRRAAPMPAGGRRAELVLRPA